ncbi:MAG: metallophosphoesterase [Ktedonobacteraceae bacterium]
MDNTNTDNGKIAQVPIYIISDIHGQFKKLTMLLQNAKLINRDFSWSAGNAILWFLGDFFDRGPDGIAVIDLVMRLQHEAEAVGGQVHALLGNHEVLLLAAYRFGRRSTGLGSNFISRWKQNGGNPKDLKKLTMQHLEWLAALPPMALVKNYVLIHADAPIYIKHGRSIEEVNAAFKKILSRSDALTWEELLEDFARRGAFSHTLGGDEFLRRFLDLFGGKRIVHGHTPIYFMRGVQPKHVTEAWTYAEGRCINVDGALFLNGPGFVYQLPAETPPQSADRAVDT